MKKILMLLTNAFDPDPRVYQEAKSLVNNGYAVTIICWDRYCKKQKFEIYDGIRIKRVYVHSVNFRGTNQLFYVFVFWLKALLLTIKEGFDIIHCHDFDTLPIGFIIGKIKRKKIIYDAHESYADSLYSNVHPVIKKIILISENFFIKRIDLLITVGEILRNNFKSRGAKNTCVIGNWKRLDEFAIPQEEMQKTKTRLSIPEDKLVICFISRLNQDRKLPELIEAIEGDKKTFLVLGGDGQLKEMVQKKANETPNIIYLGYVKPKDIPLYTCMSDVVFYGFDTDNNNSKFSAPNKLFEALAAGKPVITGNFGEIGKIVQEENCGIILPKITAPQIRKALQTLNGNGTLSQLSKNALTAAKIKYNWKIAEERLLAAYKYFQ